MQRSLGPLVGVEAVLRYAARAARTGYTPDSWHRVDAKPYLASVARPAARFMAARPTRSRTILVSCSFFS